MKNALSSLLLIAITLCTVFSLVSCKKNPIPEGKYEYKYDFAGMEMSEFVIIEENKFYKVLTENENPTYTVYEAYTFELNDEKTEITFTFEGYKFEGDYEGYNYVKLLDQNYDLGMTAGLFALKGESASYPITVEKDNFTLEDRKYDFVK